KPNIINIIGRCWWVSRVPYGACLGRVVPIIPKVRVARVAQTAWVVWLESACIGLRAIEQLGRFAPMQLG
ncbi:MAG: hypothetical protein ACK449_15430, partial [Planctomycetota bacterium]